MAIRIRPSALRCTDYSGHILAPTRTLDPGVTPTRLQCIVQQALEGVPDCTATLTMFCSILGAAAGDIALIHGARGAVLIAGGIAPQIASFLAESPFRARFKDKGRLSTYMRAIPTRLIINPEATLLGAARAALEAFGPAPSS